MDNLVYHYTSIESLKGIIREDKVTFWATRYGYLNDPFEKIWSQKYIQFLIKNEINVCSDQDFNAIDKLVELLEDKEDKGVAAELIQQLIQNKRSVDKINSGRKSRKNISNIYQRKL